eukprot:6498961-Prorocentrum_lima.AAC.1
MKNRLADWWKNGTTKERLNSSGADLKYGFLLPTIQFKRMHELSYGNPKRVQSCEDRLVTTINRQLIV